MKTETIIFLIVIAVLVFFLIIGLVEILKSNKKVKDWEKQIKDLYQTKLWNSFISEAKNMHFLHWSKMNNTQDRVNIVYVFSYGKYCINVWCNTNRLVVPYASVHTNPDTTNGDCVLCSFNERKSKDLARILLNQIKEEYGTYFVK